MNRALPLLVLGLLVTMSACGPLKRLRTRRPAQADTTAVATVDTLKRQDSAFDTTALVGPFPDTLIALPQADTAVLVDDSPMAMPWWMQQFAYTTFSGRAKAHFESADESRDFTLTVRIESGKRIWMSVVGSALGISMEAFRAVLTPDSMLAINRLDKEVLRAPFGEIAGLFPISGDFYTLEAILTGTRIPAAQILERQTNTQDPDELKVLGLTGSAIQTITFRLRDSTMATQQLREQDSQTDLSYDDYLQTAAGKFSRKRSLQLNSPTGKQTLELEYTSFSFDEPVDMTVVIPEKYKQR